MFVNPFGKKDVCHVCTKKKQTCVNNVCLDCTTAPKGRSSVHRKKSPALNQDQKFAKKLAVIQAVA